MHPGSVERPATTDETAALGRVIVPRTSAAPRAIVEAVGTTRVTARVEIRPGWGDEGRQGAALSGVIDVVALGQRQEWVVVLWDDEDDPNMHKLAGLHLSRRVVH